MSKVKSIRKYTFKRKKFKKIQIRMIIQCKLNITFKNKKNKIFINSKTYILIKYSQSNKVNKF